MVVNSKDWQSSFFLLRYLIVNLKPADHSYQCQPDSQNSAGTTSIGIIWRIILAAARILPWYTFFVCRVLRGRQCSADQFAFWANRDLPKSHLPKNFLRKFLFLFPVYREDCPDGLFRLGTTSMGIFRKYYLGFGSNNSFREFSCLA